MTSAFYVAMLSLFMAFGVSGLTDASVGNVFMVSYSLTLLVNYAAGNEL